MSISVVSFPRRRTLHFLALMATCSCPCSSAPRIFLLSCARFTPLAIASTAHHLLSFLWPFSDAAIVVMILHEKVCLRCLRKRAPCHHFRSEPRAQVQGERNDRVRECYPTAGGTRNITGAAFLVSTRYDPRVLCTLSRPCTFRRSGSRHP